MKKFFKKGLIALTLMLGMTFAVPQNASAKNEKLDAQLCLFFCDASPYVQYFCMGNNGCVYWILTDGTITEYNPVTGSYRQW